MVYFPGRIFIIHSRGRWGGFWACTDTNLGTPNFETLEEVLLWIRDNGFNRTVYGELMDGEHPDEFIKHLKKNQMHSNALKCTQRCSNP